MKIFFKAVFYLFITLTLISCEFAKDSHFSLAPPKTKKTKETPDLDYVFTKNLVLSVVEVKEYTVRTHPPLIS